MSTKKVITDNNFSKRLDTLVKTSGERANKIAGDVRLTPTAISNMSKGRSNPSPSTLKLLSDYFKVSEEWLAYGTGEKEKKFAVTQIFEPEPKKTAEHPLKLAICGYCDLMTEQQLLDEVNRLSKYFSGEQKPEKS